MTMRRLYFPNENIAEYSLFDQQNNTSQELSTAQLVPGSNHSHRGFLTGQNAADNEGSLVHRAYPLIHLDANPFVTPAKVTIYVWTDVTLVRRSPLIDDWFSFATFSADVNWARVVTVNMHKDNANGSYYVYVQHAPNFGQSIPIYQASAANGGATFPLSTWVKLTMYYDADNTRGYVKVFQNTVLNTPDPGPLVAHYPINSCNGAIFRAHFGFYGSPGLVYNAGSPFQIFNGPIEFLQVFDTSIYRTSISTGLHL